MSTPTPFTTRSPVNYTAAEIRSLSDSRHNRGVLEAVVRFDEDANVRKAARDRLIAWNVAAGKGHGNVGSSGDAD